MSQRKEKELIERWANEKNIFKVILIYFFASIGIVYISIKNIIDKIIGVFKK